MEHKVHVGKTGLFICVRSCIREGNSAIHSSIVIIEQLTIVLFQPMPLVLGESGVPYLLTPQGDRAEAEASQAHRIVGELWQVSTEALQGLDEYEGVDKGYYSRTTIPVCVNNGMFGGSKDCLADVYVLNNASQELVNRPRINEYTLEMHHRLYNAIVHVQRKQHAYLGWSASTWGKMPARDVGTDGATASS